MYKKRCVGERITRYLSSLFMKKKGGKIKEVELHEERQDETIRIAERRWNDDETIEASSTWREGLRIIIKLGRMHSL